jgi:hypothetical protein
MIIYNPPRLWASWPVSSGQVGQLMVAPPLFLSTESRSLGTHGTKPRHKVLIDCAKKFVKLTTPDGKELEYVVEPVVTAKGAVNHVKLNQLDASQGLEVLVVNEFPDVFPEELSGMSPDRDIEFVIDLMASTAHIYKRPYRMDAKQLAKLKD